MNTAVAQLIERLEKCLLVSPWDYRSASASIDRDKAAEILAPLVEADQVKRDFKEMAFKWQQRAEAAEESMAKFTTLLHDTEDRAMAAEAQIRTLREALDNANNTLRSLEHTLSTIDSDERYRAREERRPAVVHTTEIKQSEKARAKADAALTTPTNAPKGTTTI